MHTNVERKPEKCRTWGKMYVLFTYTLTTRNDVPLKIIDFASGIQILEEMWKKVSSYRFMCIEILKNNVFHPHIRAMGSPENATV